MNVSWFTDVTQPARVVSKLKIIKVSCQFEREPTLFSCTDISVWSGGWRHSVSDISMWVVRDKCVCLNMCFPFFFRLLLLLLL